MFERFTDRARRVLVLAQEDARKRQHDYLGTEHMLIGIIDEAGGVGAKALERVGVDLKELREDAVKRMGPAQSGIVGAPPFTPRAKRALELALGEGLKIGHNYIGTEHLLLGLVAEAEGIAAQLLRHHRVDHAQLRRTVVDLLGAHVPGTPPAAPATRPTGTSVGTLTPAADTVLRGARSRAGGRPIGTHDLLASILFSDRSAAVNALRTAGFDIDKLRDAVQSATTLHTSDQTPEEAVAAQLSVRLEDGKLVIAVEDETIVAALQNHGDTSSLAATNPRVAHDLGALWQQIHDTIHTALQRLAEDTGTMGDDGGDASASA